MVLRPLTQPVSQRVARFASGPGREAGADTPWNSWVDCSGAARQKGWGTIPSDEDAPPSDLFRL